MTDLHLRARVRALGNCLALGLVATALAGAAHSPAYAQSSPTTPTTITLPYLLGLTGGAAAFGKAGKVGIELAEKAINDSGGIKSLGGAKIKVELVDHQSKQDIAFSRVQDLARRPARACRSSSMAATTIR
jgi:branched-chain amino acid transport system substrate-binding protein